MIRNFLYLDLEKLRSFSSQIFEGFTENVMLANTSSKKEAVEQKGPMNSGRLLADIFATGSETTKNQYLYDHAYNLFEEELDKRTLLDKISTSGRDGNKQFIKITGKLRFNDVEQSARVLRDFNEIGLALWRTQNMSMAADNTAVPSDKESKKQASAMGLQFNEKAADSTAKLMEFGFAGLLEVIVESQKITASAPLRREFLREDINSLVHKYSRSPDSNFCMLGLLVREGGGPQEDITIPDVKDSKSIKEAMRTLSLHMGTVEDIYTTVSDNEIVIDPVAIFSEIS